MHVHHAHGKRLQASITAPGKTTSGRMRQVIQIGNKCKIFHEQFVHRLAQRPGNDAAFVVDERRRDVLIDVDIVGTQGQYPHDDIFEARVDSFGAGDG